MSKHPEDDYTRPAIVDCIGEPFEPDVGLEWCATHMESYQRGCPRCVQRAADDRLLSQIIDRLADFAASHGVPGLWPRTEAERKAAVWPTDYCYPPGDPRRYGAVGQTDGYSFVESPSAPHADNNPKTRVAADKVPLHLVPPTAIAHMALGFADGGLKYQPYNWRDEPISASVYYGAALRHLMSWWEGEDYADDSGVHHLAHAMCCLAMVLDTMDRPGGLNDNRPPPTKFYGTFLNVLARDIPAMRARETTQFDLHDIAEAGYVDTSYLHSEVGPGSQIQSATMDGNTMTLLNRRAVAAQLRDVVPGDHVYIEWQDGSEWHYFAVGYIGGGSIRLRGIDAPDGTPHDGDSFVVEVDEIMAIHRLRRDSL